MSVMITVRIIVHKEAPAGDAVEGEPEAAAEREHISRHEDHEDGQQGGDIRVRELDGGREREGDVDDVRVEVQGSADRTGVHVDGGESQGGGEERGAPDTGELAESGGQTGGGGARGGEQGRGSGDGGREGVREGAERRKEGRGRGVIFLGRPGPQRT